MRYLYSLFIGISSAAVAILLHQSLPPFGVIAGLVVTYGAIWIVGRTYSGRKFKFVAFVGWLTLMIRGGSFGAGQELLIQGDGVGSTLLIVGTLLALGAVTARN